MSLQPVVPKDAWDLSVKVMAEASGVATDNSDALIGWFGGMAARVHTAQRLEAVMKLNGLSLSADWKDAVFAALSADEASHPAAMQHVWNTGMLAVHDGILRARNMAGIPPVVIERACFPHNLFDYYDPPAAK